MALTNLLVVFWFHNLHFQSQSFSWDGLCDVTLPSRPFLWVSHRHFSRTIMRASSPPAKPTLPPVFFFPMNRTSSSQNLGLILDSVLSLYPSPCLFSSKLLKHLLLGLLHSTFLLQSIHQELDGLTKIQILKLPLSLLKSFNSSTLPFKRATGTWHLCSSLISHLSTWTICSNHISSNRPHSILPLCSMLFSSPLLKKNE